MFFNTYRPRYTLDSLRIRCHGIGGRLTRHDVLHSRVDLYRDLWICREAGSELRKGHQAGEEIIARQRLVRVYINDILTWGDLSSLYAIVGQQVFAIGSFENLEGDILVLGLRGNRIGPAARERYILGILTKLGRHLGHS